ncbi:protein indeterminate-domain 7 [Phtheirospermum japonicum]|uniref:Protein indeterminate-domain 7 n=1 Tax=Phtheirospermum japonicum TaxID=374723 RepID=A0A830BTK0_9LAMI|nr:protein indeterminate-domain 7 [Phtheirospermum japonicum]
MATNRFVCEICNKGFQRDQNLQLHRRGHNLPWKLKQRNKLEVVKRKVYVCPEPSCVHHDPSRALGDLTGIKKHFSRKHGEKKWKCEKCSKRYAVQSDWKAHSKICGTREYRCDCGTLFSRRDSFITHRAFCDALAQESSRSITQNQNPLFLSSQTAPNNHHLAFNNNNNNSNNNFHHPLITSQLKQENQNIINLPPSLMSATALLQKAAQMGVTMTTAGATKMAYQSSPSDQNQSIPISRPHHHVGAPGFCATTTTTTNNNNNNTAGLLPSREGNNMGTGNFVHGLASFASNNIKGGNPNVTGGCMQLHDMNMVSSSLPSTSGGFDGSASSMAFEDSFNEMLNPSKRMNLSGFQENAQLTMGVRKNGGSGGDGLTRDFLGLRAFPDHRDFMNMAGLDQMGSGSYDHHQHQAQNQGPWQSR